MAATTPQKMKLADLFESPARAADSADSADSPAANLFTADGSFQQPLSPMTNLLGQTQREPRHYTSGRTGKARSPSKVTFQEPSRSPMKFASPGRRADRENH